MLALLSIALLLFVIAPVLLYFVPKLIMRGNRRTPR